MMADRVSFPHEVGGELAHNTRVPDQMSEPDNNNNNNSKKVIWLSYSEGKGGRIIDNLQADTYKLITFRQAGAVAVVNLLYSINTLCRPDLTTTEQPADSTFFFGSGSSFRLK